MNLHNKSLKNDALKQRASQLKRYAYNNGSNMNKILLAGSTGYLGIYIAEELQKQAYFFRAIARNPEKLKQKDIEANEVLKAELTKPASITKICKDIDIVISTVGITRQKDGLTYMDVDYQANMNLLEARPMRQSQQIKYHVS